MNIEIEKRKITVNEKEFFEEIKRICLLHKKVYGNDRIRVFYKDFKSELKLKITELEFLSLCNDLHIKTYKNLVVISQFE